MGPEKKTTDNILILKSLIDIQQSHEKEVYCCFVDFKNAFDSVWRIGLLRKTYDRERN